MNLFQSTWAGLPCLPDKAKNLTAKFKCVRKVLKDWQRSLLKIDKIVQNIKLLIDLVDNMEERRDLSIEEWNFRDSAAKSGRAAENSENLLEAAGGYQVAIEFFLCLMVA